MADNTTFNCTVTRTTTSYGTVTIDSDKLDGMSADDLWQFILESSDDWNSDTVNIDIAHEPAQ